MTMTCLDSLGFKPLSTGNTLAESYPIFTTFYVTSMIDMHRARQIAFARHRRNARSNRDH